MSDSPKRIVVARAHGGFELTAFLNGMLLEAHYEVVDFVDSKPKPEGGWPDFVVPSARAVAHSEVYPGVAVCGTGVVASIASNKVRGVRACLIYESVSAHQGVEEDDMNVICLGVRVVANTFAWEVLRHRRALREHSKQYYPSAAYAYQVHATNRATVGRQVGDWLHAVERERESFVLLDYEGVARVTRCWEPYAGMVYFDMLLEGLSETGALKRGRPMFGIC